MLKLSELIDKYELDKKLKAFEQDLNNLIADEAVKLPILGMLSKVIAT